MNMMQTLLIAVLIPIVTFAVQGLMSYTRQKRKYNQLCRDPLFKVGAVLVRLETEGRDKPIMNECELTQARPGYYQFKSKYGEWISFTGMEVEKLYLIYKDGYV